MAVFIMGCSGMDGRHTHTALGIDSARSGFDTHTLKAAHTLSFPGEVHSARPSRDAIASIVATGTSPVSP